MFLGNFKNTIFVFRSETSQIFPCFIINSQFLVLIFIATFFFIILIYFFGFNESGIILLSMQTRDPLFGWYFQNYQIILHMKIWRSQTFHLLYFCLDILCSMTPLLLHVFYHKVHKELIMVTVYIVWSTNQFLPEVILVHTSHLNYDRSITRLN